jgi:HAE1 family hydrophobic/amphiphilic exporter-1
MSEEHLTADQAISKSARTRVRPIFMTTITTVVGLAPLVLFPGAGSELYRGLGSVLLGGLLLSTIVTLVLIPALLSMTIEVKSYLRRRLDSVRSKASRRTAHNNDLFGQSLEPALAGGSTGNGNDQSTNGAPSHRHPVSPLEDIS